jgi:hypothetical protein
MSIARFPIAASKCAWRATEVCESVHQPLASHSERAEQVRDPRMQGQLFGARIVQSHYGRFEEPISAYCRSSLPCGSTDGGRYRVRDFTYGDLPVVPMHDTIASGKVRAQT